MQATSSILPKLKRKYPQFRFQPGDTSLWSPSDNTIYFDQESPNQSAFLLHELSHALLDHKEYSHDIQLLTMERQAWDYAVNLATSYDISISDELIQSHLDSYRDWLHARSICPNCSANGLQRGEKAYDCLACGHKWRVNEARMCALRRYSDI